MPWGKYGIHGTDEPWSIGRPMSKGCIRMYNKDAKELRSYIPHGANHISALCHQTREPVYITKNSVGDMVIISVETFERQQFLINLYLKLAEAEEEIANGTEGEDFFEVAKQLRNTVHRQI